MLRMSVCPIRSFACSVAIIKITLNYRTRAGDVEFLGEELNRCVSNQNP
jgi:hypothetical protein